MQIFWCQQGINRVRRAKIGSKINTFGHVDIRDLEFWGLKKLFSGLFQSYFGVVQEMFKHYFWLCKAYFCVYFQLQMSINNP